MKIGNLLVAGGIAVATAAGLIVASAGTADSAVATAVEYVAVETVDAETGEVVVSYESPMVADFKHALNMANEVRIAMQRRVNDADIWFEMHGLHYPNEVFRAADVRFRDDLVEAIAVAENILENHADDDAVLAEALDALVAVYEPNGPYPNFENLPASWLSVLPNGDPRNLPWFSTAMIGPETVQYFQPQDGWMHHVFIDLFPAYLGEFGFNVVGTIECRGPAPTRNADCTPAATNRFLSQLTMVDAETLNSGPVSIHQLRASFEQPTIFINDFPEYHNLGNTCVAVNQAVASSPIDGLGFSNWNSVNGDISARFLQRDENGFIVFEWDESADCLQLREDLGLGDDFFMPGSANTWWRYNTGPRNHRLDNFFSDHLRTLRLLESMINPVGLDFLTARGDSFVIE